MALADDFVLAVRQIGQYPPVTVTGPLDAALIQQGGLGGPYKSIPPPAFVATALELGGFLALAPNGAGGIAFNGASLTFVNGSFTFSEDVHVPSLHSMGDIFVNGNVVATQLEVTEVFDFLVANTVSSFNGRVGRVLLETDDVLRAGGAPITNPHFNGWVTAPTPWNAFARDDTVATTAFVQMAICQNGVHSFMCRHGDIILTADDVSFALTQPGVYGQANTPPIGDTSKRIATTAFVDGSIYALQGNLEVILENYITNQEAALFAPIISPNFIGIPTAPTANPGTTTGQIATTAFVQAAITSGTAGVASFNTRVGAVVLTAADITSATGALLASPTFTGSPAAPTATPGDNTTKLATTAFVHAAVAAVSGVASFNTRTGAVTLLLADVTAVGGAPIASPTFTGTPAAPTPAPTDNTTRLATTQYVTAALAAVAAPVTSFNSRTGAITLLGADVSAAGGALIASPIFTGVPEAPTPTPGDNSVKLATTAFVAAAIAATGGGVSSFNTRSGAVVLNTSDVTGAGGAPIASPTFTGIAAAPTATAGTNSTQLATTAFVQAAIAAVVGVSSFNTRTGAVVLIGADVSAAGGALLASPTFTGTPKAPTPVATDNSTALATTAFVAAALAAGGGVTSFNGRAGVVTLSGADITGAGGALLASPALTGTPTAPTPTAGDSSTKLATTAFVAGSAAGGIPVVQVFLASGTYTPTSGMKYATIECLGGGGGGGGVTGSGTNAAAAGGGGSGGYSRKTVLAAAVGASQVVTVGGGGSGGAAASGSGGAGTATSVGSLCVANGGGGAGHASAATGTGTTGQGALTAGAVGDVVMPGNSATALLWGQSSYFFPAQGGNGAPSIFGGSPAQTISNGTGAGAVAAANTGAGGGGGCSVSAGNFAGGAGGSGIVIITEHT